MMRSFLLILILALSVGCGTGVNPMPGPTAIKGKLELGSGKPASGRAHTQFAHPDAIQPIPSTTADRIENEPVGDDDVGSPAGRSVGLGDVLVGDLEPAVSLTGDGTGP